MCAHHAYHTHENDGSIPDARTMTPSSQTSLLVSRSFFICVVSFAVSFYVAFSVYLFYPSHRLLLYLRIIRLTQNRLIEF